MPVPGNGDIAPGDLLRMHAAERERAAREKAAVEAAETARDVVAANLRSGLQVARENLAQALLDAAGSYGADHAARGARQVRPVKVGETIWVPNPDPFSRVQGWPRTIVTDAEADAVNAAIADGRPPFLPDTARR